MLQDAPIRRAVCVLQVPFVPPPDIALLPSPQLRNIRGAAHNRVITSIPACKEVHGVGECDGVQDTAESLEAERYLNSSSFPSEVLSVQTHTHTHTSHQRERDTHTRLLIAPHSLTT